MGQLGNMLYFFASTTHVGAADTSYNWIILPVRSDGKRYRLILWATLQNSGGALNVNQRVVAQNQVWVAWETTSCATGIVTKETLDSDVFLEGGMALFGMMANCGAGKYHRTYVLVEVTD